MLAVGFSFCRGARLGVVADEGVVEANVEDIVEDMADEDSELLSPSSQLAVLDAAFGVFTHAALGSEMNGCAASADAAPASASAIVV